MELGEKIKGNIPEYRTRSYWEPQLREMRPVIAKKNLRTIILRLLLLYIFLAVILPLLISWADDFQHCFWFFLIGHLLIFLQIIIILDAYRYQIRKRLRGGEDPEKRETALFYGVTVEVDATLYPSSFHLPGFLFDVNLNKLFPEAEDEGMEVLEFCIDCTCRPLHCFGTKEKYEAMKKLIHMKETAVPRKKSRVFMVTYKEGSRELIKIELLENEIYPAHCHYEELVERINIMF